MKYDVFNTPFAQSIYQQKYSKDGIESWADTCRRVVESVCSQLLDTKTKEKIYKSMLERKFIPGGRYLYSAARAFHQVNNCFLFRAGDSREEWADAMQKATAALMTGGGIGFDYSSLRPEGALIKRTGGVSTGPIALAEMVNEAGRFIMQGGSRRCLPKGSLVHTIHGLQRIEDVRPGDKVLTFDGYKNVLANLKQGYQNTIKVLLQNGEFVCTPNHKIAVLKSITGDYDWVEAQDLKEGMRVIHSSVPLEGKRTALPASVYVRSPFAYTAKDITIPELDTDLAWFIGYFHANGHVRIVYQEKKGKRNSVVCIAIPKDAPQIKDKVFEQLSRFGISPAVKDGDGECWNVKVASVPLALWMEAYIKKTKQSLNIPDFILQGSNSIRAAYVAGMLDGDGSIKGRPVVVTNTVYPEYAKQLQALVASLGVVTRFNMNRPPKDKWQALYRVSLKGTKQVTKFKEIVEPFLIYKNGINNERKKESFSYSFPPQMVRESAINKQLLHKNYEVNFPIENIEQAMGKTLNFTPIQVVDIEDHKEEETYDIEVEDRNEFYCNGILVHNSAIWAGLNWSHGDISKFLTMKNHPQELKQLKEKDFNFRLPMELTNISVIYDTEFFIAIENEAHPKHDLAKQVWKQNCFQAFSTAEPGMSFNFGKDNESLRNACVTGDTEILTKDGHIPIRDLSDQQIEVWNGFEWSEVTPKITGTNQQILTVTFNDGRVLDCTPYHKFHITKDYKGSTEEIEAKDLEIGMKLIKHTLPVIEHGPDLEFPYTQGFVAAEGMELDRLLYVYKPKEMCLDRIEDKKYARWEEGNQRYRVALNKTPLSKSFVPIQYNLRSKIEWLSGLFDGDGTELKEGGLQLASVNRSFLTKLQSLLSTVGVQSKVVPARKAGFRKMPNHKGGQSEYYCQDCFRICIGAVQMQQLKKLGLKCNRMAFDKTPQRDASQFVSVVDVTDSGIADVVYCFNEPKRHLGIFNGVITGQCTEVVSEDDSDKCNLGTIWINQIKDKKELAEVVKLATMFLMCGGLYSHVPTEKIREVGSRNNRIGLGLGGIHEWLMARGEDYQVVPELHKWLAIYEQESDATAFMFARQINVATPKGIRAIAPTGTLAIIAETTSGIEPLFCKAYKRRYLKDNNWMYQYVVDGAVKRLLSQGIQLDKIKDSYDLSFKQRVKFQADVQNYVDMAISSTCNLPSWESEFNNESILDKNSSTLLSYAKRLRGFTVYPDGARGGQPLTRVDLGEALSQEGMVFEEKENDCLNGVCGI